MGEYAEGVLQNLYFHSTIEAWRVVAGASQLSRLGPKAQARNRKRFQVHDQYNKISQSNDIALLELDQPVQCNVHVQLACMPHPSLKMSQLTTCYVGGWGATAEGAELLRRSLASNDVLQEAQVLLIDTHVCNGSSWYRRAIHQHNLCAGYPPGGIDTCQGDSGGPLICRDPRTEHFWLVGVTSWGRGCARVSRPGVYVSTQHFFSWILEEMELQLKALVEFVMEHCCEIFGEETECLSVPSTSEELTAPSAASLF
ncbi:acrosin-like [Phaenicophaeus curvirostris]|uniref:acrosin-like n=1 Tax=Phaenicophaeus curvirostris TaxID=33595 RepID=UPI0037F09D2C